VVANKIKLIKNKKKKKEVKCEEIKRLLIGGLKHHERQKKMQINSNPSIKTKTQKIVKNKKSII